MLQQAALEESLPHKSPTDARKAPPPLVHTKSTESFFAMILKAQTDRLERQRSAAPHERKHTKVSGPSLAVASA